ncbi:hypothetical protein GCM10025867_51330 (plasmid) [Frondihabitans sucicola]|uniref:MFS transporter n=1 Tax=Frondihabitans sucicola TaxID=1268041 RepID=A0ABN6Y9U4_9MICO|nr:hypothetical protein [Frondihabitans sucicola]BDZ52325.1 hypothetical protein GCM10025867_45660 [Frondihabitans sucicola]BDZ52892.1 hypothetical protein GCM10025867_51330 [Frondihabitans sucicola]
MGVRLVLGFAAAAQAIVVALFSVGAFVWGEMGVGVIGLAATTFLFSATTPGIAALAQGWWHALDLSPELSARGSILEPTLSATAWTVGPALAAPLVLLSPLAVFGFGGAAFIGWLLVSHLPDQKPAAKAKTRIGKVAGLHDWWMSATYSLYHVARALLGAGSTAVLVGAGQAGLVGAASSAPSAGHIIGGFAFAARKDATRGLARAVYRGLAGQAIPTAVIAATFIAFPHPGAIAAAVMLVGGGVLIGILKAPVAGAIYPLAATARPHLSPGRSAAIMAQGITIGGLVGPLLGTLIVSTVGAVWLLPASCLALLLCGVGVALDGTMQRILAGAPESNVVEMPTTVEPVVEAA